MKQKEDKIEIVSNKNVLPKKGQTEVFRRNHLIRLTELIKTKQSIVTFLKERQISFVLYLSIKFTVLKKTPSELPIILLHNETFKKGYYIYIKKKTHL